MPGTAVEAFIGAEVRGGALFGEYVGSGGVRFSFVGVHALAGRQAGFGLIPRDGAGLAGEIRVTAAPRHRNLV